MTMPEVGQLAPDFELPDAAGTTHRLSDYRGRWVVLYFYPRDDTPGCTTQACSFRDHYAELAPRNAVVVGVSTDSVESHRAFAQKYELPFTLLADEHRAANEAYGVWKPRERDGKTFMMTERTTFLIDPAGRIARVWPRATPADHAVEVLAALPD